MRAARSLCRQIGVKIVPTKAKRGPMQTHAGATIERLIRSHGAGHTIIVLRSIVESAGNESELRAETITAVSNIIRAHARWPALGLAFIEAFDGVDLRLIRNIAKESGVRPLRDAIATMLFLQLGEMLGPPVALRPARPAAKVRTRYSEAQVAQVQHRVAVGVELLAMKATAGYRQFGRTAHDRFGLEPLAATPHMQVARLYGDRPDITSRLTWDTLKKLSAPSLPASIRQDLEAALMTGKRVVAGDIVRARKLHPKTPAGRWPKDAPAPVVRPRRAAAG
jgi:hypothetical protein